MSRTGKRVDANQPLIVRAVKQVGALWIPTSGDPEIGFDGLIGFRGTLYAVEIKDPMQPPSKRKLTPTETKRFGELASVGSELHIIHTPEDVLKLIGAIGD